MAYFKAHYKFTIELAIEQSESKLEIHKRASERKLEMSLKTLATDLNGPQLGESIAQCVFSCCHRRIVLTTLQLNRFW